MRRRVFEFVIVDQGKERNYRAIIVSRESVSVVRGRSEETSSRRALDSSILSKKSRLGELYLSFLNFHYVSMNGMLNMIVCFSCFLDCVEFLEIFQKSLGGPSKSPGDSCHFLCNSGLLIVTAWRHELDVRRCNLAFPVFGFLYE